MDKDTQVIEAVSVSMKTLVDRSLRITVEIEPRAALAAFTLFQPGAAMALAAIKQPETDE